MSLIFEKSLKIRVAKAILIPLLVAGLLTLIGEVSREWLVLNLSHSMKRGIYLSFPRREFSKGSLVLLSVPKSLEEFKRTRDWLKSVNRLLKIVAGISGDRFCFINDGLEIGGTRYLVSKFDRLGEPMPRQVGCGVVGKGEVFVLGQSEDSFDSRYFGAVRLEEIEKVVRPLFIF